MAIELTPFIVFFGRTAAFPSAGKPEAAATRNMEESQVGDDGIYGRISLRCGGTKLNKEKKPGWLGYIGDEILPSYLEIIIRPYNKPLL